MRGFGFKVYAFYPEHSYDKNITYTIHGRERNPGKGRRAKEERKGAGEIEGERKVGREFSPTHSFIIFKSDSSH